jgi:hypothetical protein
MTNKKQSDTTALPVKLINTKGQSSLVEFEDNGVRRRVFIPSDQLIDGKVSNVIISRAIPFGYPWEEIQFTVGGADLAAALHKLDLWTIEDVLKYPKKLRSALETTLASQLKKILEISHGEKKGVNNDGQ